MVCFSDESKLNMDGTMFVWRKARGDFPPSCTILKHKHDRGCFLYHGGGDIVFLDGIMNLEVNQK